MVMKILRMLYRQGVSLWRLSLGQISLSVFFSVSICSVYDMEGISIYANKLRLRLSVRLCSHTEWKSLITAVLAAVSPLKQQEGTI